MHIWCTKTEILSFSVVIRMDQAPEKIISMAAAAFSSNSGNGWPYISNVVEAWAWPIRWETVSISTPSANRIVAEVCRRSCNRINGSFSDWIFSTSVSDASIKCNLVVITNLKLVFLQLSHLCSRCLPYEEHIKISIFRAVLFWISTVTEHRSLAWCHQSTNCPKNSKKEWIISRTNSCWHYNGESVIN